MAFKEEFSKELDKLKHMSISDRIWYLWEYYKIYLAIFLVIIAVISVIATALYNTSFTTRLGIAVINNHSSDPQFSDALDERLRQILNCGQKDVVEINGGLYLGDEATVEDSYLAQTKLAALMASDALDVIIADVQTIQLYAEAGSLCDLSQELPDDLKSKVSFPEESVYYILIDDTWLTSEGYISQDCTCLAVLIDSPRKEAAFQMIRSLFP